MAREPRLLLRMADLQQQPQLELANNFRFASSEAKFLVRQFKRQSSQFSVKIIQLTHLP